jgi:hypothetical protein
LADTGWCSGLRELTPPRLALYRDGRAIADAVYVIRLTPGEANRLVSVLTRDLKAVRPSPSPPSTVMDAPDTVLTAGRFHVRAPGLDATSGYPRALYDARDRLANLARRAVTNRTAYTAGRVRLVARPVQASGGPIHAWPSGIPVPGAAGVQVTDLSGDAAQNAIRSIRRDTAQRGDWPVYRIAGTRTIAASWRYLLPDE